MKRLTKEQIIHLHRELIEQTGGSAEIRDDGLLESAVSAPFQTFDSKDLYPSLLEKAAQLGYGLIKDHPFVDGNKRIGVHAMLVFLAVNYVELQYEDDELVQLALGIASGTLDRAYLLAWLEEHIL